MLQTSKKESFICQRAAAWKIKWTAHALGKLASVPVTVRDIEISLCNAQVIEDYPHAHRYLPDCLVLTFVTLQQPLHCVVALNEPHDYILVVTVYEPTPKEWNNDWRTRK